MSHDVPGHDPRIATAPQHQSASVLGGRWVPAGNLVPAEDRVVGIIGDHGIILPHVAGGVCVDHVTGDGVEPVPLVGLRRIADDDAVRPDLPKAVVLDPVVV